MQSRRHAQKENTEKDIRKKSQDVLFSKKISFPVLFVLGLGIIKPYSLAVLISNFYQTFLIVCIDLWPRFEPQIHSTRFAMNFLFINATIERKVCFCVKLFYHFLTEYSSV